MPLAPPLRASGALVMIALRLGDWKNPNPAPHNAMRQPISKAEAPSLSSASAAMPALNSNKPIPHSSASDTRSARRPAISAITARPGDSVTHGQELCVLEAMKMKNSIRATRPGKVEKIHVEVGAQVRQGQPLVSFTD